MKKKSISYEKLSAFIDGELDSKEREALLGSLDESPDIKADLCDMHRIKDLLNVAYPLGSEKREAPTRSEKGTWALVASLFLMLSMGFIAGYFGAVMSTKSIQPSELAAATLPEVVSPQNKVIIYLGSSRKAKFDETLDKAEELLKKYKQTDTQVFVVTSAGGIDLLRTSNTGTQQRIKYLSQLYSRLHFVACNNQIYELHKKGQSVNLVEEAEVAPSAVQFVVDHLKNGWQYIAI